MMDILLLILQILAVMDILTIIVILIIERNDLEKFLEWSFIVLLFPFLGVLGYFLIGQRIFLYGLYRKKRDYEIAAESQYRYTADTGLEALDGIRGVSTAHHNDVTIFSDGVELFNAMEKDVNEAKESIFMEYYILINDEIGNTAIEMACRKAQEGVDVMIIGDGFGFRKVSEESIERMRATGVRFTYINKLRMPFLRPTRNNCDHRKILTIDGRIMYCGGFNMTKDYVGAGHLGYWRDSAVRIEGDISRDAEMRFLTTWHYASGETIPLPKRDISYDGNDKVSLIYGGPDMRPNPIMQQYISMMESAKDELLIETPYFNNIELVRTVRRVSESGTKVKIILPGRPDHWFTFWNNYHAAKKAMRSGAEFYLYDKGFMHSKVVIADGKVSSIGSANYDDRTAYFNFDANVMFHTEGTVERTKEMFLSDLKECRPFDPSEYSGMIAFFKILICSIVRPLA